MDFWLKTVRTVAVCVSDLRYNVGMNMCARSRSDPWSECRRRDGLHAKAQPT